MTAKGDELQARALKASRIPMRELAAVAGVSRESMSKYLHRDRKMPQSVRLRLAKYYTKQARILERIAAELTKSAR